MEYSILNTNIKLNKGLNESVFIKTIINLLILINSCVISRHFTKIQLLSQLIRFFLFQLLKHLINSYILAYRI